MDVICMCVTSKFGRLDIYFLTDQAAILYKPASQAHLQRTGPRPPHVQIRPKPACRAVLSPPKQKSSFSSFSGRLLAVRVGREKKCWSEMMCHAFIGAMAGFDRQMVEKELQAVLSRLFQALEEAGVPSSSLSRLKELFPRWQIAFSRRRLRGREVWQLVFYVVEWVEEERPSSQPGLGFSDVMPQRRLGFSDVMPSPRPQKSQKRRVNKNLLSLTRPERAKEELERVYKLARQAKVLKTYLEVL